MHEHSGQEIERIEGLGRSQAPVSLSSVENLNRGLVDPHSVEADWRMELTPEALETKPPAPLTHATETASSSCLRFRLRGKLR